MAHAVTAKKHRTLKEIGLRLTAPDTVEYDRKSARVGRWSFALIAAVGLRGSITADAAAVAVWGTKDIKPVSLRTRIYKLNCDLERLGCAARVGQYKGSLLLTY